MLYHTPTLSILTVTEPSVADFNGSVLLFARTAYENREIKTVDSCPPRNLEYRGSEEDSKSLFTPMFGSLAPKLGGRISRAWRCLRIHPAHPNVFPDWHEEILDLIVTEEKVVTRYLSSGTHQGEYLGFGRTGRKILFEEISIYRIKDNLVAEQWCLGDDMHCISQLKQ